MGGCFNTLTTRNLILSMWSSSLPGPVDGYARQVNTVNDFVLLADLAGMALTLPGYGQLQASVTRFERPEPRIMSEAGRLRASHGHVETQCSSQIEGHDCSKANAILGCISRHTLPLLSQLILVNIR